MLPLLTECYLFVIAKLEVILDMNRFNFYSSTFIKLSMVFDI